MDKAKQDPRLLVACTSVALRDNWNRPHAAIGWTVVVAGEVVDLWQVYRLCRGEDNGAVLSSGSSGTREGAMAAALTSAASLGLVVVEK